MKKYCLTLLLLLSLPLNAVADTATVIDEEKNPSYLFVITADSGSLEDNTLTLNNPHSVLYFADRPHRIAGHMALRKFINHWDEGMHSFEEDPPNAVLSILASDDGSSAVIELLEPRLSDDALIFDVVILEGKLPKNFTHGALFIDSVGSIVFGDPVFAL